MKPISLIRSDGSFGFVEFLAEAGVPAERLWARAGLPPRALFEPDRLIPLQLANRFIEDATADRGLNDLGLRVARRSGLERGAEVRRRCGARPLFRRSKRRPHDIDAQLRRALLARRGGHVGALLPPLPRPGRDFRQSISCLSRS
jgi:hypothetical protein